MRQYTSESQTAKLIELGFKPITRIKEVQTIHSKVAVYHDCDFTIGELLSFLPTRIYIGSIYIDYNGLWRVGYENTVLHQSEFELIDALYFMCVKLKEKGVI